MTAASNLTNEGWIEAPKEGWTTNPAGEQRIILSYEFGGESADIGVIASEVLQTWWPRVRAYRVVTPAPANPEEAMLSVVGERRLGSGQTIYEAMLSKEFLKMWPWKTAEAKEDYARGERAVLSAIARAGGDLGANRKGDLPTEQADGAVVAADLAGLECVRRQIARWVEYDVQQRAKEGLTSDNDTHLVAPPVWPSHGQLRNWIALFERLETALAAPASDTTSPTGELKAADVVERLTRPIIGIENRSAQEAFDIMADRIRAALATQVEARQEGGWQDIATYHPDDHAEHHVLIAEADGSVLGARLLDDGRGWWARGNDPTDHWGEERYPTHWQPLPAAPTAADNSPDEGA